MTEPLPSSPADSDSTEPSAAQPADVTWGAFSDDAPWVLDQEQLSWRVDLDARRREVRAAVPELTRARRLPPGGRVLRVAADLGGSLAFWRLTRPKTDGSASQAKLSKQLRKSAERLGPTYIKLGQIISSGQGVFPAELVDEFKKCRDQVPAEPFTVVRSVVEAELGRPLHEVFVSFEPAPLAAASIAQVHRALLRTDDGPIEVVVKVQRPTVARYVHRDLAAMAWLAPFLVGRIPVTALANPPALVEVFAQSIVEELDFRLEAENMLDVARSLAALDQRAYVVPRPHPTLVTEKVLVMQRMHGFGFEDVDNIRGAGIDLEEIVRTGMIGFLEGALIHGIFHGDLHGGNLFVQPDGRTALLDYGIVGRLTEPRRVAFLKLLVASTTNDVRGQVAAIRDLGALPPDTDIDAVITDLGLDQIPVDPTTLSREQLVDGLNQVVKQMLGYGARMPRELLLFAKNMVFVDAAISTLTPDLDLFAEVQNIAMWFAKRHGNQLAADVGLKADDFNVDLTAMKGQFGIDPATESLTYRELQARREIIQKRLAQRS